MRGRGERARSPRGRPSTPGPHRARRARSPAGRPGPPPLPPRPGAPSAGAPAPDLPGFHYDPERKRYFRLLPGHNNCNPLTQEGLRRREAEGRRLRLLAAEGAPRPARPGLHPAGLLGRRRLGLCGGATYCRRVHELKAGGMPRRAVAVRRPEPALAGGGRFKLVAADAARERLFTVHDVEQGGCRYGLVDLRGLGGEALAVELHDNLYFTNRRVNAVCWASLSRRDSHVLLCLMGAAETLGCASLLPAYLFTNSDSGDQPGMLCSFKISTAWSCAWCLNPQADNCFSTGLSLRVLVTNATTGHQQTFGTDSDVLAQQFAFQAPVLYNGCRSGEIFSIDVRQHGHKGQGWKAARLFHDSAITSVNLLEAEQHLVAADMAGQIKLWDLRTLKCVQEYRGHHNEHALLPLHVNEEEGLLTAVGQDCYTRIWSLRDAHLLRTIPSPYPSSKDSIPSVVFSSRLGGARGVPGLLMAVRQDLYYFSYKTDDPYSLQSKHTDHSTVLSD